MSTISVEQVNQPNQENPEDALDQLLEEIEATPKVTEVCVRVDEKALSPKQETTIIVKVCGKTVALDFQRTEKGLDGSTQRWYGSKVKGMTANDFLFPEVLFLENGVYHYDFFERRRNCSKFGCCSCCCKCPKTLHRKTPSYFSDDVGYTHQAKKTLDESKGSLALPLTFGNERGGYAFRGDFCVFFDEEDEKIYKFLEEKENKYRARYSKEEADELATKALLELVEKEIE